MRTEVIIAADVVGFHFYPGAPKEVDFLSNEHRHLFRIEAGFLVSHDDREIEIFIQTEKVMSFLESKYGRPCIFGAMSCEMIAKDIAKEFGECSWVKVLEDNLGGAIFYVGK